MQLHTVRGRKAVLIAQSAAMTVEALEHRTLLSGLTGTSGGFDVTDQLVFTSQPPNMVASGKPFQVQVSTEDAAGNLDTSFSGPITVSDRYTNDYGSPVKGDVTVNAVNGVATFPDLTQKYATSNAYESDALFASSGNLDGGQSSDFAIYQDQFTFLTQPPRNVTAGSPIDVQIGVTDQSGNVDSTFSGVVVLSDLYSSYGYLLNGNLKVKAVNGIASFTGVSQNIATNTPFGQQVGEDILFAYGYEVGLPNAGSHKLRIQPANATQLVINGAPADTNGDMLTLANAPLSLEVDAEDQFGNIDTSFSGGVTLSLSTDPTDAILGGTTTMAASKGVANFTNVIIGAAGDGYVLQASGLGMASSYPFSVTDQLVFTTQPTGDVFVGSTFNAVVEAEDGAGNLDSSFIGSVTLSDMYYYEYYSAVLSGNLTVNAVGGVASFTGISESFATANTDQNEGDVLYADSSDLAEAASNPFTTLNPASQLLFTSTPADTDNANLTLANAPLSVQVQAIDVDGNINTSFNGNVTLTLASNAANIALGGTTTVAAVDGVATFTDLTIGSVGYDYTLLASGDGTGLSAAFSVSDQLVFSAQPPGTIVAGAPFGMVVEAQDGLGNLDTSFDGDVNLSDYYSDGYSNATLNGTVSVTAVGGIATFSGLTQTFATSNTYDGSSDVIFADSNGLPEGDSSNVIITGAAATQLVFLGTPANTSGGYNTFSNAPLSVQVEAEDMYGNIADPFNGPITVALGDGSPNGNLGGTTTVNAVQGIASFANITIDEIGDGFTLVASGVPNGSVISYTFSVTDQLVFTTQPPGTIFAGTSFKVVVAAEDGAGKVDTSFTGSVTLSDQYSYNYFNANLNGTLTVNAVGGVATFTGISQGFGTANTYQGESDTLYADGGGLPEASSADVVISSDQLNFTTLPPNTVTAGSPFTVVVEADDSSGNPDTSFNGPITLSDEYSISSDTALNGRLTVNAVNGVATFIGISRGIATATMGGQPDVLFADGAGSAEAGSNDVTINAAAATQLVFTSTPTDTNGDGGVVANAPLFVQVQAQDQYGNIAVDFNGIVTLTLGNNPTGATLGGATTTASDGIATYSDLTISIVGAGYTLIANAQSSNTSLAHAHSLTGVEFVIARIPKYGATIK